MAKKVHKKNNKSNHNNLHKKWLLCVGVILIILSIFLFKHFSKNYTNSAQITNNYQTLEEVPQPVCLGNCPERDIDISIDNGDGGTDVEISDEGMEGEEPMDEEPMDEEPMDEEPMDEPCRNIVQNNKRHQNHGKDNALLKELISLIQQLIAQLSGGSGNIPNPNEPTEEEPAEESPDGSEEPADAPCDPTSEEPMDEEPMDEEPSGNTSTSTICINGNCTTTEE